jgi:hypothetical protein
MIFRCKYGASRIRINGSVMDLGEIINTTDKSLIEALIKNSNFIAEPPIEVPEANSGIPLVEKKKRVISKTETTKKQLRKR